MDKKIILEKIFPSITKDILPKLQIDYESMTYITIPSDTKKIYNIALKHLIKFGKTSDFVIVDCTAGAGGDTISFAKYFKLVISIEFDIVRYNYLKNNINAYGYKNVRPIYGNCIDIVPKIKNIDVIYIDPPWGGKQYKNTEKLRLSIGTLSIESLIKLYFDKMSMMQIPKLIILKLPKNYDIANLYETVNDADIFDIYMYELKKMLIIVISLKTIDQ